MDHAAHHRIWAEAASARRRPFHRPDTSLGLAAHWIKEAGILAPIAIGEFVPDPAKKWRYIKLVSLATALLSEGMWTWRCHRERQNASVSAGMEKLSSR